ncbi:MAG TPA: hypothetical protein PLM98_11230, partial [Thiolinea sp.]|nr:hypothetical protein [Thiolinea sp.]
ELTGTNEDTAFFAWLHQQAQGKDLPLIGIVDKQPAQASEQWVTAYLGKPFDYEHLHAVLSKTLGLD